MRNRCRNLICCIGNNIYVIVLVVIIAAVNKPVLAYSANGDIMPDTIPGKVITYSAATAPPFRLLFDYYHHHLPSTKVGNHIITGSWNDDNGRYGWDDFVHTNTFDPVYTALGKEFSISMTMEPYSKSLLSYTDGVVIFNPDNPHLIPDAKVISDAEIDILRQFVKDGGSLMVMVNSGGAARYSESFESDQLRKLVNGFGLDWNNDDTHYSDNIVGDENPHFYDVPVFHYGAGCTLKVLNNAQQPDTLLNVYSDAGYTDRKVKGPGIIMVRSGKGKFILVGDVGSWTGNISRPWAENERVLRQLFRYMKTDRGVTPPQLTKGKTWNYEVTVAGLQGVPVANTLSAIPRPHYRMFSPRPITQMPYIEASADIHLTCVDKTAQQASRLEAAISNFHWFDEAPLHKALQKITMLASRQGKVSRIDAEGPDALWLAPDIDVLVALLPVDGIRPGDSWETIEPIRVPILRGTDPAPSKKITMETTYVNDITMDNKDCRLLRASGEMWLDELGVKVEDLLPPEEVLQVGGPHYEYLARHGGKLLFKREQWVDKQTGIVVKAKIQVRIVAWVHDLQKPINRSNADKDNNMVVSLAHIINFQLK